jgi:hypothetical protein
MKHATLSASGSERWINCPGSVSASKDYPRTTTVYADEGTIAHEIADRVLKSKALIKSAEKYQGVSLERLEISVPSFNPDFTIPAEMVNYVQEYVDYVLSFETAETIRFNEKRVDYSHYVPNGFGTCDAAIYNPKEKTLHIFDLKYGKGVEVYAEKNTQAMLYAIGFLKHLTDTGVKVSGVKHVVIHICQPRREHFDSWKLTTNKLNKFAIFASTRAAEALKDNAPLIPGDKQCQFCPVKPDCIALKNLAEKALQTAFDDIDDENNLPKLERLSDKAKRAILKSKKLIQTFLEAVEKDVFKTLANGNEFKGYKLVEGRSNRAYTVDAEDAIVERLGEFAYSKKLIGVTELEKKLGKEFTANVTYKPSGKPTLVKDTDKREAVKLNTVDLASAFDDLEGGE